MPTNINKLNHITLKAIHLKDARLCELVQKYLALVNYCKEKSPSLHHRPDANSDVL